MNYSLFIPTATIVLIAFFGVHYGMYLFLTHFFSVFASHRLATTIMITILSLSFFVSMFLAHASDNAFSRGLYFFSGVWIGTLVNILLAMLATGIVLGVSRAFSSSVNASFVAGAFLVLALAVSAYGVWNAMHPRIRNVSVTIPNLPEEWRGKKIVQISDVHIGHVYREAFLRRVVEGINDQDPKLVVITGDLFDGMDGGLIDLVKPLDDLKAQDGVLFVDGNHETYLGTQLTLDILKRTKVRILRDEVADIDGLSFIGIMYPERGERKTVVETLEKLKSQFEGKPNVLLYHAPQMIEDVAKKGVNLQLSGHTHRGQQFPFQFVTHLVHKGYDYGLYRIGDYSLYVSSGVGTWGPTERLGTQSEIVVITLK